MDSTSFIIATDSGSFWGRSFGAEGVTYVRSNAYKYDSEKLAGARIAELAAGGDTGDTRGYDVEALPADRRRYCLIRLLEREGSCRFV